MDKNILTGPILPLRDLVVFPSITSPLFVGRTRSIDAINFAMNSNDKFIYLFTQREPTQDDPKSKDLFTYGVKSKIIQFLKSVLNIRESFLTGVRYFMKV